MSRGSAEDWKREDTVIKENQMNKNTVYLLFFCSSSPYSHPSTPVVAFTQRYVIRFPLAVTKTPAQTLNNLAQWAVWAKRRGQTPNDTSPSQTRTYTPPPPQLEERESQLLGDAAPSANTEPSVCVKRRWSGIWKAGTVPGTTVVWSAATILFFKLLHIEIMLFLLQ